ncbi:hypothetical protein GOODEAATRI_017531 [Goodea atripinnis]|uniref:LIM zinc-binding domain-containing protein n=1 Tax=Goodea atripinnis TaxID=208336 RepID=A0ABV0MIN3_9TELE
MILLSSRLRTHAMNLKASYIYVHFHYRVCPSESPRLAAKRQQLFGNSGACSACAVCRPLIQAPFCPKCFTCSTCRNRLVPGDRFHYINGSLFCEHDRPTALINGHLSSLQTNPLLPDQKVRPLQRNSST